MASGAMYVLTLTLTLTLTLALTLTLTLTGISWSSSRSTLWAMLWVSVVCRCYWTSCCVWRDYARWSPPSGFSAAVYASCLHCGGKRCPRRERVGEREAAAAAFYIVNHIRLFSDSINKKIKQIKQLKYTPQLKPSSKVYLPKLVFVKASSAQETVAPTGHSVCSPLESVARVKNTAASCARRGRYTTHTSKGTIPTLQCGKWSMCSHPSMSSWSKCGNTQLVT